MQSLPKEYFDVVIWFTPILSLIFNIVFVSMIMMLTRKKNASFSGRPMPKDELMADNMREAEFQATELVKDATMRAKKIIEEAGVIRESLEDRLDQSLEDMNKGLINKLQQEEERILSEFRKLFGTLTESYQSEGTRISERFKDEGDTMVKTFIQSIHAEINSVREKIFSRIDSKLSMIEEDLGKYREQQYEKLRQNIVNSAKDTLTSYLKDALSYEIHEQIIFKSLEKYKSQYNVKNSDVS